MQEVLRLLRPPGTERWAIVVDAPRVGVGDDPCAVLRSSLVELLEFVEARHPGAPLLALVGGHAHLLRIPVSPEF
jgi:hypothetical protein